MSADAAAIAWYLRRDAPETIRAVIDWPEGTRGPAAPYYTDRIATRDVAGLLEQIERLGGASTPGLAGVAAGSNPSTALPLLLRASADVRTFFEHAVLYWRVLSSSRLERRDLEDGAELIIVDEWRDRRRGHDLLTGYLLGMIVGVLRHAGVTPSEIRLPGELPLVNGASQPVFGISATGGADFGSVRVTSADLARPLATADPYVEAYLRTDLSRALERLRMAISWQVDELIRSHLEGGLGMREAARVLGVSERTLRRRLDEEGTSFRERLDQVRRSRALELLAHEGVGPVARSLGFVDSRSFQRAFRRWTGMTPSEHRRAASGAPNPLPEQAGRSSTAA